MNYLGDFRLGDTFDTKFVTTAAATGAPTTLSGVPVISAYPGNSTTELTAGITLTVDFDARTGLNNVRVVATSGNGYATATNYQLVITTGTVGGTSAVGYVIGEFSIENRSALMSTTAANKTLDVTSTGEAGLDYTNVLKGTNGAVPEFGIIWSGTAGTVTANTIVLTSLDATVDDNLIGATVYVPSSTNGKQSRGIISAWNNTTKVATLKANWTSTPTGTVTAYVFATAADSSLVTAEATIAKLEAAFASSGVFSAGALVNAPTNTDYKVTGTATSGSTNSMIDTARIGATANLYVGWKLRFTSGVTGVERTVRTFDTVTGAFTWDRVTPSAISTNTYELRPGSDAVLSPGTHTSAVIPGVADLQTRVPAALGTNGNMKADVRDVLGAAQIGTGIVGDNYRPTGTTPT